MFIFLLHTSYNASESPHLKKQIFQQHYLTPIEFINTIHTPNNVL
jgi:hypothetical protein